MSQVKLYSHILKKNLGRAMVYPSQAPEALLAQVERAFEEEKSYKKKETIHLINRNLSQPNPCKWRRKYWSDVHRHYDQKRMGFFVSQVLARKNIAIPLR